MAQWYYKNLELGENCGECVAQQYCLGSNAVAKGITDGDLPSSDFRNIQQGLDDCSQGTSSTFVSAVGAEAMGRGMVPESFTTTRYDTPAFRDVGFVRSLFCRALLRSPAKQRISRATHNGILAKRAIKIAKLKED